MVENFSADAVVRPTEVAEELQQKGGLDAARLLQHFHSHDHGPATIDDDFELYVDETKRATKEKEKPGESGVTGDEAVAQGAALTNREDEKNVGTRGRTRSQEYPPATQGDDRTAGRSVSRPEREIGKTDEKSREKEKSKKQEKPGESGATGDGVVAEGVAPANPEDEKNGSARGSIRSPEYPPATQGDDRTAGRSVSRPEREVGKTDEMSNEKRESSKKEESVAVVGILDFRYRLVRDR